jgi:hypothetical protein
MGEVIAENERSALKVRGAEILLTQYYTKKRVWQVVQAGKNHRLS